MQLLFRIPKQWGFYLRDPEETELGRKIVSAGIVLMDKLGFEQFTFRKLSVEIGSTEASIYRYFSNKGSFLRYCRAWYWSWLSYRLRIRLQNIAEPERQLHEAVKVLAESSQRDYDIPHIDESALHRVVIYEGRKGFLAEKKKKSQTDPALQEILEQLTVILRRFNPRFRYAKSLALQLILTAHGYLFYFHHDPMISEVTSGKANEVVEKITNYLLFTVQSVLNR
jgi:AcrR family transcriptional regulator